MKTFSYLELRLSNSLIFCVVMLLVNSEAIAKTDMLFDIPEGFSGDFCIFEGFKVEYQEDAVVKEMVVEDVSPDDDALASETEDVEAQFVHQNLDVILEDNKMRFKGFETKVNFIRLHTIAPLTSPAENLEVALEENGCTYQLEQLDRYINSE